ncbi:MAG: winged helix-turn-helix transcriptional regulator, partial [Bacteroidales bacterium]|nr:winged helix-turn-helix transcriptional regulator [Bacteroidales bacterium]
EFGGVTAIIKRELFQAIQHGGSVINKRDDLDHDPDHGIEKLTDRQASIVKILAVQGHGGDLDNDPETMSSLAQKLGISDSTVKRELKVLVKTGWIKHFGPDRGGRWLVIKNQNKSK